MMVVVFILSFKFIKFIGWLGSVVRELVVGCLLWWFCFGLLVVIVVGDVGCLLFF